MKMIQSMTQLIATAAIGLTLAASANAESVVVVVNPKSSVTSLTADQVANLYLGKTNQLGSGSAVVVDLPEASASREHFYGKATGKTTPQVKAIWSRLMFSGKATPPKELGSSADVKKFVASNPDAIGYIEKSALDGSVMAVLTLD